MKIKAALTERGVSITGIIAIPEKQIFAKTVNFMVDTGDDITLLSEVEAIKIGIDFSTIKKAKKPSLSMGGTAENYILNNVIFIFQTEKGGTQEFEMSFIHISQFPRRTGKRRERNDQVRMKALPNLLGRDFLSKYKIKLVVDFNKYEAYLEY